MFTVQNVLFMLFMLSLLPAGAGFLVFCYKLVPAQNTSSKL